MAYIVRDTLTDEWLFKFMSLRDAMNAAFEVLLNSTPRKIVITGEEPDNVLIWEVTKRLPG